MTKQRRAIVLAAGKGTRLHSEQFPLPKVLRELEGEALLLHVLRHLPGIAPQDTAIVIGYKGELVMAALRDRMYAFRWQKEQLGTGHAVRTALDFLEGFNGSVLICYGDMPMVREASYDELFRQVETTDADACILAYDTDLDLPYGRIIRDERGDFQRVVEARDCSAEQLRITELNAGVYVFRASVLRELLPILRNDNAQHEYYVTDIPGMIRERGGRVTVARTRGRYEGYGVNTPEDLDLLTRVLHGGEPEQPC